MANKYQIKKFLELKMNEALKKLEIEYKRSSDELKHDFTITHAEKIAEINVNIDGAYDAFEDLISDANLYGDDWVSNYYSNPKRFLRDASKESSPHEITKYFKIKEVELLKIKYEKTVVETTNEYKKLMAVIGTMTAKNGIEYIKNLGFDVSDLEIVQECTAITTVIDPKKLFIKSEDMQ